MGVNYTFRIVDCIKDLFQLRDFLLLQPLWYPKYEKWVVNVCIPDIESGWKTVILAFYDKKLVGDAIYQPHKELQGACEFKKMRIHQDFRRRDIGHFLLRQVEEESKLRGFSRVILDIDSEQTDIKKFLEFCGYNTLFQAPLYNSRRLDIIMGKEI